MGCAPRPCESCGRMFVPRKNSQRVHANSCKGGSRRDKPSGQSSYQRGMLGLTMVIDWDPGQRQRIRDLAYVLGEWGLIELIDGVEGR